MSVAKEITIWCDQCSVWYRVNSHLTRVSRKKAARQGWITVRNSGKIEDICPTCAESREDQAKE